MRKVLITRYGAVGDHLHATHLPRLLKEKAGFDYVAVEYNPKGKEAWLSNPFVDEHIHFNPTAYPQSGWSLNVLYKRWEEMLIQGNFEKHINLQMSIEYGYIAMENMPDYYRNDEYRRTKFGGHNYYDQTSLWTGYPEWCGEKGELHFLESEENLVKGFYEEKYKDNFVLIANLSGTSKHKIFYNAEPIIKEFLALHPDAVCFTMGDKDVAQHVEFKGERIRNYAGIIPYRQSMLMTKYANCTIGAESGLMVAATLLGCPTVQLMTAASIKNHGGNFVNDFSLQSPVKCSPCHKGPYDYIGCPTIEHLGIKYPACIKFESQTILNQLEKVYDNYRTKKENKSPNLSSL